MTRVPVRTVLFFREDFFYPVDFYAEDRVENHVRLNPGTVKVVDAVTQEILWERPQ